MLGEYPPIGEMHERPVFYTRADVQLSPDYLAEEIPCPLFDK